RLARRERRFLAALHPAFGVDVGAMLLGISRARQYEVRLPRSSVAVVADIDLERALEAIGRDFIGAKEQNELRRRRLDIGDAARLRVAEDQTRHPRGGEVENVIAVPSAISGIGLDQAEAVDQRQARTLRTRRERAAADD